MLITPENGSPPYYATVTMADEPTDEGTPLTKANLLKDITASLMSLSPDATVDDMFNAIATLASTTKNTADANTVEIQKINNLLNVRIGVMTYTGFGSSSGTTSTEVSLTWNFRPVMMVVFGGNNVGYFFPQWLSTEQVQDSYGFNALLPAKVISTGHTRYTYGRLSADGKTVYWRAYNDFGGSAAATMGFNYPGGNYTAFAIGVDY